MRRSLHLYISSDLLLWLGDAWMSLTCLAALCAIVNIHSFTFRILGHLTMSLYLYAFEFKVKVLTDMLHAFRAVCFVGEGMLIVYCCCSFYETSLSCTS